MGSVSKALGFSKPKMPDPPPPPKTPPPIPTEKEPQVSMARETIRKRAAVAQGRDDDIHTSPLGAPSRASTGRQSLLGR